MTELAKILTDVAGEQIVYDPVSLEEFAEMYDEPKGFGALLASMYKAGEMVITLIRRKIKINNSI